MINNTQQRNNVNVNSTFATFYSTDSKLSVMGWNTQLSLKIQPSIGTSDNGYTSYDDSPQNTAIISIPIDKAIIIKDLFENKIFPAITSGTDESVAVVVGSKTNKKILNFTTSSDGVKLILYTNVDDNGKTNDNISFVYQFNTTTYSESYDPTVGMVKESSYQTELTNFYNIIKEFIETKGVETHLNKYKAAYAKSMSNNNYQTGGVVQQQPTLAQYNAPQNNFSGDNMKDFLPFQ